jgi:hypothetical protein
MSHRCEDVRSLSGHAARGSDDERATATAVGRGGGTRQQAIGARMSGGPIDPIHREKEQWRQ